MDISPTNPVVGRRFNLLRTLGEGSFGVVYLAEMASAGGFKRRVALKLLHNNWDPESDAGRRLRDEARLLGRLEHRNIVRVDDLIQLNGRWALVMEYVSGADLATLVEAAADRGQPLSPRAIAELGSSVCSALVAAWNAPGDDGQPLEVVHRDIKPSNIRLSEIGEVKVLDFGVARAAVAGREAHTERVRYGSLGYMAPERLLGDIEGPEGDIYALGVVLWEALTLKVYGRAELGIEQQAAQMAAAHAALADQFGDHPVVDLITRTFSYLPGERPTAAEMEEGLRTGAATLPGVTLAALARDRVPHFAATGGEAVRGTVLEESISGARTGTVETPVEPLPEVAAEPLAEEPRRSRLPLFVFGGIGLLALVAIALVLFQGPGQEEPPAPVAAVEAPPAAPVPEPPPVRGASETVVADAAPPEVPVVTPPPGEKRTAATKASKPTAARPEATKPEPVATVEAVKPAPEAAPAPRLRAAKFTLEGADGITVQCGDVRGTGSTSALLRDFPAGPCTVTVADHMNTTVRVDAPRGVTCTVAGDSLQCR